MPPIPCANAPSAAKLFVQLCARRSISSSSSSSSIMATTSSTSASSSILDVLLPPRIHLHYLGEKTPATGTAATSASLMTSRSFTPRQQHAAVTGRRRFTSSRSLAGTLAVYNAQKDDDGKDMVLEITPRAANRLSQIMSKDKNPYLALRVQVEAGGCHGFQYLMSLTTIPSTLSSSSSSSPTTNPSLEKIAEEEIIPSTTTSAIPSSTPSLKENDTVFVFTPDSDSSPTSTSTDQLLQNPKIILDLPSLEVLQGSKVDYTMELIGSQFKIVDNPLAESSCGCGTSFNIKM